MYFLHLNSICINFLFFLVLYISFFVFFFFETGSPYVVQAGLELEIFLLRLSAEITGYVPPCQA
jgi:hypothetical protein